MCAHPLFNPAPKRKRLVQNKRVTSGGDKKEIYKERKSPEPYSSGLLTI
jgi:hypothetical protein